MVKVDTFILLSHEASTPCPWPPLCSEFKRAEMKWFIWLLVYSNPTISFKLQRELGQVHDHDLLEIKGGVVAMQNVTVTSAQIPFIANGHGAKILTSTGQSLTVSRCFPVSPPNKVFHMIEMTHPHEDLKIIFSMSKKPEFILQQPVQCIVNSTRISERIRPDKAKLINLCTGSGANHTM